MPAEFNHIYWGLLMVGGPWATFMIFVVLHKARLRLACLGLKAGDPLLLEKDTLIDLVWLLVGFWCFIYPLSTPRAPWLPFSVYLLLNCLVFVPVRWKSLRSRWLRPKPARSLLWSGKLWQGPLSESVRALARKGRNRRLSLHVLPDDFRTQMAWELAAPVLIPRRFLDRMSRAEIDALAARQLARLQRVYLLPPHALLLGCGLAAVGLCELLNAGIAGRWLTLLVLVAAEMAALALYFPLAEVKADLRAIGLTGNPDAFFSALVESARLNGAAMDLASLEKIARRTGVSADRLQALLQQQPRRAEDRYPTSGDYVTVGF